MDGQREFKPVLATQKAAEYIGVTYHSFRKLVAAGHFAPIVGTKLYRRADLDRFVQGKEVANDAP